jgi:lipopolysaccharide/colanic/teichoic acid biosynthesis glycosyltransferase
MNKTNYNDKTSEKGYTSYRETFFIFINGLGTYFSVVLISISLLIFFSLFLSKTHNTEVNSLLPYTGITPIFLLFYSIATAKTKSGSKRYKVLQILKRLFDLTFVSFCFFSLMPFFILIIILIKIDSAGPVFFRTKRVGQFGKIFDAYTFRTNYLSPDQKPVTHVGKILRRYSLDTLPMFYNVLEGEISLVGPWPRLPKNLTGTIDIDNKILTVKPGMTGLVLISHATSPEHIIELDLEYVEKWSLFLDLKILLKTLLVVLMNV